MVIIGLLTLMYVLTYTITFYTKAPDKNKPTINII